MLVVTLGRDGAIRQACTETQAQRRSLRESVSCFVLLPWLCKAPSGQRCCCEVTSGHREPGKPGTGRQPRSGADPSPPARAASRLYHRQSGAVDAVGMHDSWSRTVAAVNRPRFADHQKNRTAVSSTVHPWSSRRARPNSARRRGRPWLRRRAAAIVGRAVAPAAFFGADFAPVLGFGFRL